MKSILIVDDDAEDLQFLKETLAGEGYRVQCLSDSEEALAEVSKHKPDLMILDVLMPKLDGAELAHQLHLKPDTAGIPFIFLTSAAFGLSSTFLIGDITYEVFGKPFKKNELLRSVRRILSPAHV